MRPCMNNVGCTHRIGCVQRWVTPSGPGPSVHRIRSYRIRSHEYAMSMPTCTPPTANDALGRKWCRNPGVLAHVRLAGDASPACLAGHPVPPRWGGGMHGAHAKTRQTRIHHDRRTGAPCQATQCVYPYRPLTNAPRPLCQHCRRVRLPSELPEADAAGEVQGPANE